MRDSEYGEIYSDAARVKSLNAHKTKLNEAFDWLGNEQRWEGAACRNVPGARDLFGRLFDIELEPKTSEFKVERLEKEALAREICRACGILDDCSDYVLPRNNKMYQHGFFAGMNSDERKELVNDKERPIVQVKVKGVQIRGSNLGHDARSSDRAI